MAGMLTVVNPRRRRRSKTRRPRAKRKSTRRRRRSGLFVAKANPRRRRRARRAVSRRRRRHSNPSVRMGGIVGTLTKGAALGAGAIATNLATNGVNKLLGANALNGPAKLALKAGVGLVALPMLLKFVPGGKKFAAQVALGAGIVIALDIFDQYIKESVPAYLQDYEYGSLNDYQYGALNGWAPQDGMSGGAGVYDDGVYN